MLPVAAIRTGNTLRYESKVWLRPGDGRSANPEPRPVYDIFFVRVK